MNGNVVIALVILAWLVIGLAFMVADINRLCREQLEQDELDELWFDGDPSAERLEVVQATASAE